MDDRPRAQDSRRAHARSPAGCCGIVENFFRLEARAVIGKTPASQLARLTRGDAHNDVAIPRPGVLAVKFAGPRWMVWMRVIPSDQLEILLRSCALGGTKILRGNRKTVARRILAAVDEGKRCPNFAAGRGLRSQQCAAAFVRIVTGAVRANGLLESVGEQEHDQASSQKRSLKYFSPESGNTVTISARSPGASPRAT